MNPSKKNSTSKFDQIQLIFTFNQNRIIIFGLRCICRAGYDKNCLKKAICELACHPIHNEDDDEHLLIDIINFMLTYVLMHCIVGGPDHELNHELMIKLKFPFQTHQTWRICCIRRIWAASVRSSAKYRRKWPWLWRNLSRMSGLNREWIFKFVKCVTNQWKPINCSHFEGAKSNKIWIYISDNSIQTTKLNTLTNFTTILRRIACNDICVRKSKQTNKINKGRQTNRRAQLLSAIDAD